MKEIIEKTYQEYLTEQLDHIFIIQEEVKKEYNKIDERKVTKIDGVYYLLDNDEKIIEDSWFHGTDRYLFDKELRFVNGYARVWRYKDIQSEPDGKRAETVMNIIDTNGKLYSKEWFDEVDENIKDGCLLVKNNGKYNFVGKNGELIGDEWYDGAFPFNLGVATIVKKTSYYRYSKIYDSFYRFDKKYDCIDTRGQRVFNKWGVSIRGAHQEKLNKSFVRVHRVHNVFFPDSINLHEREQKAIAAVTTDLNGYKLKRTARGYEATRNNEKIVTKYSPIMIYGASVFALCLHKNKVYLFNRQTGKYFMLGEAKNIEFDEYFITDLTSKRTYFVYDNVLHDITEYYDKKLKGKKVIYARDDVKLLTQEEFFIKKEDKIRAENERIKKEIAKEEALQKMSEEERQLYLLNQQAEYSKKVEEIEVSEAIRHIENGVKKLEKYDHLNRNFVRIKVSNLFVDCGDHKEIRPFILQTGLLKIIDLSMETFENVKISGIDFSGSNISLLPQKVYNKDLSGCNFEGVYISSFIDFTGVDIRGAKFSRDDNPNTLDLGNPTFANAIYDEATTYDGIPFTEIFSEKQKQSSL